MTNMTKLTLTLEDSGVQVAQFTAEVDNFTKLHEVKAEIQKFFNDGGNNQNQQNNWQTPVQAQCSCQPKACIDDNSAYKNSQKVEEKTWISESKTEEPTKDTYVEAEVKYEEPKFDNSIQVETTNDPS